MRSRAALRSACLLTLALSACSESPSAASSAPPPPPAADAAEHGAAAMAHLAVLAAQPREVGSSGEAAAVAYLEQRLGALGLSLSRQPFLVLGPTLRSENLVVELPGRGDGLLLVGGHYDSTAAEQGSLGASDNASSLAALLVLAEALQGRELPYHLRLVFFGAEEIGLQGSKAYVRQLQAQAPEELERMVGMINLDTIGGGDILYAHSAMTEPYSCSGMAGDYSGDPGLREALLSASRTRYAEGGLRRHGDTLGYPAGETGAWSDHVAFACAGIPVAYLEATNFEVYGQNGQDGYSQTVHPGYWSCYDPAQMGACDPGSEALWGEIWHTGFDRLELIERDFPGRMRSQLERSIGSLIEFIVHADHYLAG